MSPLRQDQAIVMIALTGHAVAQDAAYLQLQALVQDSHLPIRLLVGLTEPGEAHAIHQTGGQVWLCGDAQPSAKLAGLIDYTLEARDFQTMAPLVVAAFESLQFALQKKAEPQSFTEQPHHG